MEKFDLSRALAGEPIVDAQGRGYIGFKKADYDYSLPYFAYEGKNSWWFNENGECIGASSRNLFMKHSKQNTMKPFDLEAAKNGDFVINSEQPNVKGVYLLTLGTSCQDEDLKHISRHLFIFTQPCGRQYIGHCKDDGSIRFLGLVIRDGNLYMAPKKVKYYFASWERNIGDPGDRASTQLFLRKEVLIKEMGGEGNYPIHEIEIEE